MLPVIPRSRDLRGLSGRVPFTAALLGSLAASALFSGCGGSSADGPVRVHNADAPLPCEAELSVQCGAQCSAEVPCPTGMYCSSGTCTADCTPAGQQCAGICTADGHCVVDDDEIGDLGFGQGGMSSGAGGGTGCIQQGVEFETITPSVLLLVDRSGSMDANFGGGEDRWNSIRDILVDPAMGFVNMLQDKVRFGLMLYTFDDNEDEPGMAQCPDLIETPIALNNYQTIHDVFMANETGNNTPTAESLTQATARLEAYQEMGPKVIVLATDGDPDDCADPDSNGTEPPRTASLTAVQDAWTRGIKTYVISVGDDATESHLTDLAKAGRADTPDADFYLALDSNQLVDAFSSIIRGVVSCDFELNGTVEPGAATRGTVAIDSMPVTYGVDWEMPTPSSVRLLGSACDQVKLGASRVDISFPCGSITFH